MLFRSVSQSRYDKRMATVWKGRKHSAESIEKIKRNRTGIMHSAETKAKMSKAHKGRKITWGDKLSDALRSLTDAQVSDIKKRLMSGEKVKDLAVEYGRHRTTISKIKMGKYP